MKKQTAILVVLFFLALFLRTYKLGGNGLSEDEANKMLAVQEYREGDFTANGEHPMFMKSLSTISVIVCERLNRAIPSLHITPEAALRFPVALAGSLMIFALFALGSELFGKPVGLIASALWAVDINTVALTRFAKEDTLVVLFFVLGNYFLLRGKKIHFTQPAIAKKNYIACGACFGAMFASKYLVPLPWVTLFYYDVFRFRKEPRWRIDRKTLFLLYGCAALVFLVLNPVVVTPGIIQYGWKQFTQQHLTHHGYYMMGRIYLNSPIQTLWGVPSYFYPLYIFVKTPLPLFIFLVLGFVYTLRRFREDHFLFLGMYFVLWTFLLTLSGGKFTRYIITISPSILLLEAIGIYLVCMAIRSFCEKRSWSRWIPATAFTLIALLTVGWTLVLNLLYLPNQSFYVCAQGGGKAKSAYYFPQDDIYDAGLREAVQFLARKAPKGSKVLGATPALFQYYSKAFGRPDLNYVSMAGLTRPFPVDPRVYVLSQDYRKYIEDNYIVDFTYSQLKPLFEYEIQGITTVKVCFFSRDPEYAKPYWNARHWPGLLSNLVEKDTAFHSKTSAK